MQFLKIDFWVSYRTSQEHWHGVGPFDIKTGTPYKKKASTLSATEIYSKTLMEFAKKYENIVGVTAAMPSGTGLKPLIEEFPDRFWDVGIAEQHAVTSMAAMAKEGFKPFVTIYSTFLQRAYDQIIHDTCIMNLPVVFAIDRAGIVGEDGETHQGAFDISYLRAIPNITLFAPRDPQTMQDAVRFAYEMKTPCAFRYPRGAFLLKEGECAFEKFELGKSQLLKESESDILFIGYGNGVGRAIETAKLLPKETDPAILDLKFVKPLDENMLKKLSKKYKIWFVFSDGAKMGGVGSAILEFLSKEDINNISLLSFEFEDKFIPHGKTSLVENFLNLNPENLAKKILTVLEKKIK